MRPEEVTYYTNMVELYAEALKAVTNQDEFDQFIATWEYWLDDPIPRVWSEIAPDIEKCRPEKYDENDQPSEAAMALVCPSKLLEVGMVAAECCAPWGCAYIRMKELGVIKY